MKLLLHTCCAPCSVYCIDSLRSEGIESTVYWFNPNIHPYMEYKARRDTLKQYTEMINIETIFEENYGLKEFCKNVSDDLIIKCAKLAASHSKAKNSSNVPVDYCLAKYVKKPSGAKPGMVIYTNYKTVNV